MRLNSIPADLKRFFLTGLLSLLLLGCAIGTFGANADRINKDQAEIERLEVKRQKLEGSYIITMNLLETHLDEGKFLKERDVLNRKLQDLGTQIAEKRKMLDQSFLEWEKKIVEDRIQQEMIRKEEVEAADRPEDPDNP